MSKSFAGDFRKTFEDPALPEKITARFHITERLGFNAFGETFLLSEKDSGDLFVLKKCRKSDTAVNEAELLRGLEHKGLPNYEKVIESEDEIFISRRYIKGVTLIDCLNEEDMSVPLIVNVVTELCDILTFLHSQPAPIIHRDIKPSNIILNTEDNTVSLIDFGISRKYSADSKSDTVYFGTQDFAPPEQYGFAQTDNRSDIYSLGIVLRFLLTGTTDRNAQISDKNLARIAAKCTALAPEMRYQSAAALKKALHNYKNRTRRRIKAGIAAVFAACLVFVIGINAVGRETSESGTPTPEQLNETPPVSELPYITGDTVDIQLIARDSVTWADHTSDIVTITGNGRYTARIDFDGGYPGFLNLSIVSEGATFENGDNIMDNAVLAPNRFHSARIVYDTAVINDSVVINIADGNYRFVRDAHNNITLQGHVFSNLWNAWYEPERRLSNVELHEIYDSSIAFKVPDVPLITSIKVTFTIDGVDGVFEDFEDNEPVLFLEISQDEFREFALNNSSGNLMRSGTPMYECIDGEGLRISGRMNNYDAVDLRVGSFPPGYYVLKVELASDEEISFELANAIEPWGGFINTEDSTNTTITYNLLIEEVDGLSMARTKLFGDGEVTYQDRIRMQTVYLNGQNFPHPDFIIKSIRIYEL
jgi:serine/threonine protein kinase